MTLCNGCHKEFEPEYGDKSIIMIVDDVVGYCLPCSAKLRKILVRFEKERTKNIKYD